jgi:hypothetical protein
VLIHKGINSYSVEKRTPSSKMYWSTVGIGKQGFNRVLFGTSSNLSPLISYMSKASD